MLDIQKNQEWDFLVIGGGASGLGVALDAVSRGYKVLLVEKVDFGKGTSSRSTKLIHGGVRYLQQGNVSLVREALKERAYMLSAANHISKLQPFIIPFYSRLTGFYYFSGLKAYDLLAGSKRIGKTIWLNKKQVIKRIGNINSKGLKGGILYYDGQFDDTRLCIDLIKTIVKHGGTCINYCGVTDLVKDEEGNCTGAILKDEISNKEYKITARSVINATGVFTNDIIHMDDKKQRDLVKPSRGSHIVLEQEFLGGNTAIMIPKTSDGRVLFLIPWNGKVLVGTTDIATDEPAYEPKIEKEEIDFILNNTDEYLKQSPGRIDIKSTFSGLRPLAAPKDKNAKTKEISRGHQVIWTESGLCSLIGGKWTTFRKMGEDVIEDVIQKKKWVKTESQSETIQIDDEALRIDYSKPIKISLIKKIIKEEMVMTLEDLVARRTRLLFLDTEMTKSVLEEWCELLMEHLGKDQGWKNDQVQSVRNLITSGYEPIIRSK
ncbi:MAG: glycerol-3-phosphate dehydrogenase/oxidase [Saprospiraceae bacterium]|nr:glycerol-3-phosphate dehydrogenase/oxidase [Saprospiraceae bacterium]